MKRALVAVVALVAGWVAAGPADPPEGITYKKSWIRPRGSFKPGTDEKLETIREGDTFEVVADYCLDPSEYWNGKCHVMVFPCGPWIDNPDGVHEKNRRHVGYPGLGTSFTPVTPGTGTVRAKQTLQKAYRYNSLFYHVRFRGGDDRDFPWTTTCGAPPIERPVEGFDLVAPVPGGLFVEGREQSVLDLVAGSGAPAGKPVGIGLFVLGAGGTVEHAGTAVATMPAPGETAKVDLAAALGGRRGVFLAEGRCGDLAVDAFFGVIPDVEKELGGKRAPFGTTDLRTEAECTAAARLGLSVCRMFTGWGGLVPRRGEFDFERLDTQISRLEKNGIRPWLLLTGAPEWALPPDVHSPGFEPFPFDEAFRDRMRNGSFSNDWNEVGWRGTMFGNGDIWIDGTIQGGGKIAGVNYESAAERKQRDAMVEAERKTLHESLADFCAPMHCFVTEDGRTAGRIDALDDGPQFVRVALFDTPVRHGAKPAAVFRARNTGGETSILGGIVFPDENGRWLVDMMTGIFPSFITPVFLLCERNPLSGEPPRGWPATPAKWEAILSNAPVRDEQRLDEMGPRCDGQPKNAKLLDENGACAVFAGETAEDVAFNEALRKGGSESPTLRNSLFYRWKGPDGTEDWRLLLTTGLDGVSTYDERDIRNPDHLRELKACFNVVTAEFSRTGCGIRLTCDPNEDGHTVNCWLDLYSDGKQLRLVDDWSSEEKHFDDDVLHWLAPEEEKQKAAPDVETDPDNMEEVLKSLGL